MQASGTVHLFRLVHVLSGAFWFGAIIFLTFFLMPSLRAVGPAGGAVMEQLASVRRLPIFMMTAAVLTILSGWALYARDSGGFTGPWMRSGSGIVFGLGGVAGTLGAIVGMAITSPAGKRMGVLAGQIRVSGSPPSAEQLAEMQALPARIARGTLIVAVLVIIATTAMAVARYVA